MYSFPYRRTFYFRFSDPSSLSQYAYGSIRCPDARRECHGGLYMLSLHRQTLGRRDRAGNERLAGLGVSLAGSKAEAWNVG